MIFNSERSMVLNDDRKSRRRDVDLDGLLNGVGLSQVKNMDLDSSLMIVARVIVF